MTEYERIKDIVRMLRAEGGCPWDREQTHVSLKPSCIEEACEVVCGIDILDETGNPDNLKEELGDLLLQVLMHAQIAEEEGYFTMEDVCKGIADKMIRRHPHVFGDAEVDNSEQVLRNWDRIKMQEKQGKEWMDERLPAAFAESKDLIDVAAERKRRKKAEKEAAAKQGLLP